MDVQRLINDSIRSQWWRISQAAGDAMQRLDQMHAVAMGVCGCGIAPDDHTWWDEHTPVEQYLDKGFLPES